MVSEITSSKIARLVYGHTKKLYSMTTFIVSSSNMVSVRRSVSFSDKIRNKLSPFPASVWSGVCPYASAALTSAWFSINNFAILSRPNLNSTKIMTIYMTIIYYCKKESVPCVAQKVCMRAARVQVHVVTSLKIAISTCFTTLIQSNSNDLP